MPTKYDVKYYEKNKTKYRAANVKFIQNNPVTWLLSHKRSWCKRKGVEFDLEVGDIHVPLVCPFLGVELRWNNDRSDNTVSLDRIDPTKGYVKGNVQLISLKANRMKNNATTEELLTFAKNVIENYKEKT